jgi:tetratricopeptide (TPR) repeat protein
MNTKKRLHTILILIALNACLAQSQIKKKAIDSIIKVTEQMPDDTLKVVEYGTLFEILQFSDPDLAHDYTNKALVLSKKTGYKKGIAGSTFQIADYHRGKGNIDSARFYYDKAENLAKEANSLITELFINHSRGDLEKAQGNYEQALKYINKNIEIYRNADTIHRMQSGTFNLIGSEYEVIGSIHMELGNYQIALSETLKALKFFEDKKDTIRQADALMQLGSIENILNNYESAIEHGKTAYEIYDSYNDVQYKAFAANNIGSYYLAINQVANAESFFNEALRLSKDIESKEIEANALNNLGDVYLAQKEFEKAATFYNRGLDIYRDLDYKKSISSTLNQLSLLEKEMMNLKKAKTYIDESIRIGENLGTKDVISDAYAIRSTVYEDLGNYKSALKDYKLFKSIGDSLFNSTKSQQIEEMRAIFDTEKKEQQIAQQETEITLLEEKEKVSKLQKMALGGGLGLSALALCFGFYGFRQKIKRNRIEKEKVAAELQLKESELVFKKKELTTHALHLAKKNEVLEEIKQKAKALKTSENESRGYQQLIHTINFDQQDDKNWENFTQYFEQVHKDFSKTVKVKYPDVTKNELRLMALLKMNLSSKEIATILNISSDGVKKARQRLRKKMELSPDESLESTVLSI